jgi:hypothetical protein
VSDIPQGAEREALLASWRIEEAMPEAEKLRRFLAFNDWFIAQEKAHIADLDTSIADFEARNDARLTPAIETFRQVRGRARETLECAEASRAKNQKRLEELA